MFPYILEVMTWYRFLPTLLPAEKLGWVLWIRKSGAKKENLAALVCPHTRRQRGSDVCPALEALRRRWSASVQFSHSLVSDSL